MSHGSESTPDYIPVTPDSRCDYIVYTLRDQAHDVVAVLIETTTQHPKFKHAVAQVTSLESVRVNFAAGSKAV